MADKKNQDGPSKEELQKQLAAAQSVLKAQQQAASLKEQALKAINPKERARLLRESYDKEVQAHGESRAAKRMASGTWQGAAAGGGIGGGVGLGLGAVVGTVLGGVLSVPTVALGGLVGAGVGGVHGPFVKLGLSGSGKEKKSQSPEEAQADAVKQANALDEAVEYSANNVPVPPKIEEDEGEGKQISAAQRGDAGAGAEGQTAPVKKKPRKIEVRSNGAKKPKKLDNRSANNKQVDK